MKCADPAGKKMKKIFVDMTIETNEIEKEE
jgi:hypothetical protein